MAVIALRFVLLLALLLSCGTPSVTQNSSPPQSGGSPNALVWEMKPESLRLALQERRLEGVIAYLAQNQSPQIMQQALLLGPDSLYAIALIFAEQKQWELYRLAMHTQSYSGSAYGQRIALRHMAAQKIFSIKERLDSLQKHLQQQTQQQQKYLKQQQDREFLVMAATLALEEGRVELALGYWERFLSRQDPKLRWNFEETLLGLKLALLLRNRVLAGKYMRQIILEFPVRAGHRDLQRDLEVRPEWRELLREGREGPELLQSLGWKVGLFEKKFSRTFPLLFATDQENRPALALGFSGVANRALRFWWSAHTLVEDTGRALFVANKYRRQVQNVRSGRKWLESLLEMVLQNEPVFDSITQQSLAYWYIRNQRSYQNLQKYRSLFYGKESLREWLLLEYLYFFENANHWADLPEFLRSWKREQPGNLDLNVRSIRLLQGLYREMFVRKKTALLRELYEIALDWGNEELILESAWNYRLAQGRSLTQAEWEKAAKMLRARSIADIRLFVLRADQNEPLLPELPLREPEGEGQNLYDLLLFLIDYRLDAEALRLGRKYSNDLAPSSIAALSRRLQEQGEYAQSMRIAALLTYDENYNISKEALELFYPRPFFPLMERLSKKHDLPLSIFYAMIRKESYFAPAVVSRAGAVGLSQLMPATMREVAAKLGLPNPDAKDPKTNLEIGSYYLRYLLDHRGTNNFTQALMAYNAGIGRIQQWKTSLNNRGNLAFANAIPVRETRLFVQKISATAIYYALLYGWDDPLLILRTLYPSDYGHQQPIRPF